MLRVFIALELSPEVRDGLARDMAILAGAAPRLNWSNRENLHLTLRFLGDLPENRLDPLFSGLSGELAGLPPFALEIAGVGCFPNWRHPRVIRAGCGEGEEDAIRLAAAVEEACRDLDYEPERRPFRPHVTLARVRRAEEARGLETAAADFREKSYGFIDADNITVFLSDLRRGRPVYSPMARIKCGERREN